MIGLKWCGVLLHSKLLGNLCVVSAVVQARCDPTVDRRRLGCRTDNGRRIAVAVRGERICNCMGTRSVSGSVQWMLL